MIQNDPRWSDVSEVLLDRTDAVWYGVGKDEERAMKIIGQNISGWYRFVLLYNLAKWRDKTLMFVAWHMLPRQLVMWCAIRVTAHATTGQYSSQVVPELSAMDAIGRWGTTGAV